MNKAIFLDRDGTIIKDKHYAYLPDEMEFIDGVLPALLKLQKAGFLLIVVTNQSGIARGLFTEDDLRRFNGVFTDECKKHGVSISKIYYCPHHPEGVVSAYSTECACRKPKTGLFFDAVQDFDIDLSASFAIGDNLRDCAICLQSGCRGCLIGDNVLPVSAENISVYSSFAECAEAILKEQK